MQAVKRQGRAGIDAGKSDAGPRRPNTHASTNNTNNPLTILAPLHLSNAPLIMSAEEKGASHAKLGPAPTRLRQIALAAKDLDNARQLLTYVLGIGFAFEDDSVEQWGLKNFIGT